VVGAEDAPELGQQILEGGLGAGGVPRLAPPAGEVVPCRDWCIHLTEMASAPATGAAGT